MAVEEVPPQGVAFGKVRMVEIAGGIEGHPGFFHDATGTEIRRDGEGYDFGQLERFVTVPEHGARCLAGEALSPIIKHQPPADFDGRSEVGFETDHRSAGESDEIPGFTQFEREQPESVVAQVGFDPVGQSIALGARKNGGEMLHNAGIGVQFGEWLSIGRKPGSQTEPISLDHGHIPYASLMSRLIMETRGAD